MGGRNGRTERQVPRLAASLSCSSLPSSSAFSRGWRKVISDLTPKSQLLVAAPRSGMSAAPSQGSDGLTLSSPHAQGPTAAAPLTPARRADRLLGRHLGSHEETTNGRDCGALPAWGWDRPARSADREPEKQPELAERRGMFGSC